MPLPVRFIFFLVGPNDSEEDFHETGRAFATLMSSPVRDLLTAARWLGGGGIPSGGGEEYGSVSI